jgi:hypothetical protein
MTPHPDLALMTPHPDLALPLPVTALREYCPEEETNQHRVSGPLSDLFAQMVARPREQGRLLFHEVHTPGAWNEVKRFRLEQYRRALPYMLDELGPDGSDDLDSRSCTFAARWNGEVVATIRLTPHPFETSRYVPEEVVAGFLGSRWRDEYLEWSRLLVDMEAPVRGLASSIIVFAGLRVLFSTPFRGFFGYATTEVQQVFAKFCVATHTETFSIPRRGPQRYVLLKGDFVEVLDQWTGRLRQAAMGALGQPAAAVQ